MYDEAINKFWPCHLYQSRRQEAQEDGHGQNVRIEVQNLISDILHYYEIYNLLLSSTAMKV